jgi:ATP-binding cassette, subfamily B, multidrug efflux pump
VTAFEDELRTDVVKTNTSGWVLLGRLFWFAKPYAWQFTVGTLLVGLSAFLAILPPLFIGALLDALFHQGQSRLLHLLPGLQGAFVGVPVLVKLEMFALLFLTVRLLDFFVDWANGYWLAKLGQNILNDVRMTIFRRIHSMHLSYFHRNPIGRLVTRTTSDIAALEEMLSVSLVAILKDFAMLAAVAVILVIINPILALFVLGVVPAILSGMWIFRKYSRAAYQNWRAAISSLTAFLAETLNGIRVVQLFGIEKRNEAKYEALAKNYRDNFIKQRFAWAFYRPVSSTLQALSMALVMGAGGGMLLQGGSVTLGMLVSFLGYAELFFVPIRDLSEKMDGLQNAMTSAERIFTVLDAQPEMQDLPQAQLAPRFTGKVTFSNVRFAYNPDEPVLKGVSFNVDPGKSLAIVGPTGAGKTTIINLVTRFYEPTEGVICIDDHNIRDYKTDTLRQQIAVVHQDVFLFAGNILDNIRLSNAAISEEQVRYVCKTVGLDAFIARLPEGYQTQVAEGGKTFSVGERQLLSFARALAYDPRILILDEATANIDTHSEERIQKALIELTQGRTSIIIAHRLSTIQRADEILVLQQGQVAERGTHQGLLKQRGLYFALYQLHFGV